MRDRAIAVVVSGFPRFSETFILNELLALDARGALAGIFATKPGDGSPLQPDCERLMDSLRFLPPGSPAEQGTRLACWLAGRKVNAIHGHFAHAPAQVACEAAQRLGVPYGFSVHARDARKVSSQELAERAGRAACVIACNPDVAQEVRSSGARVHLMPHGVDVKRFWPRPLPPAEPFRLLAVGRLVEKKGFHILMQAAARLTFPFRLKIFGDGPERSRLQRMIDDSGLGDRVTLCGATTHADLPAAYVAAHAVVVPSLVDASGDRDGLPNVVLEAMASARLVVASTAGAISSAVTHGITGILTRPGDAQGLVAALESAEQQPRLRAQLGWAGRQHVERHYDLSRCAARFCDLLERAYA